MHYQFTGDLLPHLVDNRAKWTPDTIYSEYPVSPLTYDEGYRRITYPEFANAINGVAHWLVKTLGASKDFETLAYIGPNDIRYPALILGAVKAGYKLFLTSPRNSVAAQFHLFDRLDCKVLISPDPQPPAVTAIKNYRDIRIIEVQTVLELLDTPHPDFEYRKSWPEALSEPLFVIHTSGSTGLPKPLVYTHATAAANIKMMSLDPPNGYESQEEVYRERKFFIAFPPFHGAYLVLSLFNCVPFGTAMIAPISGAILSGTGLVESLKQAPADVAFLVPSIVQDLAQDPELLYYCSKNLKAIIYCGGDLPQRIGDIVGSKIRLLNQFGASELGLTPAIISRTDRGIEDWKYTQFHPELGLELRQVSDDAYELYAVRDPDKVDQQPTFTIFPTAQEYASRDLFVRHPSKPDLWSWHARADDIIVFLNGEKTNPISMEQHIVSHNADISAALVIGAQRFQIALLIEPINTDKALSTAERAVFIEKIRPTIEEANKDAPAHARLEKSHVLFTQPNKPMLRAGKGTVQRAGTLKAYASEIDALYRDADLMTTTVEGDAKGSTGTLNEVTVSKCIEESLRSIAEWSNLDKSANFFALGMDSLQALTLVRKLRQSMAVPVPISTVYTNPSIVTLTAAILSLLDQDHISKTSHEQARIKERNDMIQVYRKMVEELLTPKANIESNLYRKQDQEFVILTGSTGTLGSYILDAMLRIPNVAHVYCLNRADDGFSVQTKKNRLLGLQSPPNDERVSFLRVDFSQRFFDLGEAQYEEIKSKATLIVHNAWTVNFNLSLSSFQPQLENLINLLAFSRECAKSAHFFYISSISSVLSYHSATGKSPEKPLAADIAPGPNGYSESKYIAEHIIDYTAQTLSSSSSVSSSLAFARVGQIAGAAMHDGLWNKDEWSPSMIISSAHIGALPDSLGSMFDRIDWVPIDLLATILVELALKRDSSATPGSEPNHHAEVYHPLNPHATSWSELGATVLHELRSLTQKPDLKVVPLQTWVAMVRKEMESVDKGDGAEVDLEVALRRNPAAKLLDFFEGLVVTAEEEKEEGGQVNRLEYEKTLERSETMRGLEPIREEWVRKWMREWF